MQTVKPNLNTVFSAVICATGIFAGTFLLAAEVSQSRLYRQSQIFHSIASQEQLSIVTILQDGELRNLLTQFMGAVTNAYVNFEMIPYNEGQTFVAVLQSVSGDLHIEQFEYKKHNLVIKGIAATPESYQHFVHGLRETGHFQSVSGHSYLTVEDAVRFEIECVSSQQGSGISFPIGKQS